MHQCYCLASWASAAFFSMYHPGIRDLMTSAVVDPFSSSLKSNRSGSG